MDIFTKEQRSKIMQSIKSKDTGIEIKLRKALWKNGIHYRKNYSALPGTPDIVLTKYKIAIFCDSEFWHGYNLINKKIQIKTNSDYWVHKIKRNIERDLFVNDQLLEMGWIVLRFWGWQINKELDNCVNTIMLYTKKTKHITS